MHQHPQERKGAPAQTLRDDAHPQGLRPDGEGRAEGPEQGQAHDHGHSRHARFEALADGQVLMTYGETNREYVFELLRWLGPEAELIEPKAWRAELRDNLARMLALYA